MPAAPLWASFIGQSAGAPYFESGVSRGGAYRLSQHHRLAAIHSDDGIPARM
jgi:hypothetical protein